MSRAVLVFILAVILVAGTFALKLPSFQTIENQRYCARKLNAFFSDNDFAYTVRSVSVCASEDKVKRASLLVVQLNSRFMPHFDFAAFTSTTNMTTDFEVKFGFDQIVEYVESGQTPGFQRSQDKVVREFYLNDVIRNGTSRWQPITCFNIGTDMPVVCNTSLITNDPDDLIQEMTLQATATPVEVQITLPSGVQLVKQYLTPHSLKLSVEVNGIQYTNNSTSIALGTFLIARGMLNENTNRRNVTSSDTQTPDEATNVQDVLQLQDPLSAIGGGFFSWDRYVAWHAPNDTLVSKRLINAGFHVETDITNFNQSLIMQGYSLQRIWFTPENQIDNFVWDPTAGVSETTSSSSNAASIIGGKCLSFIILVITFIVLIF
jgi:hypothetical protein